jgi:hypothetical protein
MPNFKISLPDTSSLSIEKKVEALESAIVNLANRLTWIIAKLDSQNVKRLDTNETEIKSADGTTEIIGSMLVQKDADGVTRIRQGYDAVTNAFIYEVFDSSGDKTIGIDSGGAATFIGTITGGTIIGDWDFSTADSIGGLETDSGTTGPGGSDNHTHSIPALTIVII